MKRHYELLEFNGVREPDSLPSDIEIGIRACVSSAFGGTITESDASDHMVGDQILAVINQHDKVVGFSSTAIMSPASKFPDCELSDVDQCYFAGAAVARNEQGNGIYHILNRRRLEFAKEQDKLDIFTQTQNPRVIEGISHTIAIVSSELGLSLSGVEKLVRRKAYGSMLTADKPFSRQVELNDIDYEAGDAYIMTWHLSNKV